jgi:hypothetical protein
MLNTIANKLNFDNLVRTINNYSSNYRSSQNLSVELDWTRTTNNIGSNPNQVSCDEIPHIGSTLLQNQRDIESLLYPEEEHSSVIIEIYERDNFLDSTDSIYSSCIILPIGTGCCYFGSLVWSRPTQFSDFDILYKGYKYKVDHKDLEFICRKIRLEFEYVIKTYIENNMDVTATICHLIV